MAGVDSAGLGEVIQNILARFPDSDKSRLARVRLLPPSTTAQFNSSLI